MKTEFNTISDTELQMTRVFPAPREAVYRACTEPAAIAQWWGRRDTTTTVDTYEFRPGGAWRFVEADNDGNEFAFRGEILEIVPNEKVVQTFEFEPMPGHIVTETAVYEDVEGGTRLTVTSSFLTPEDLKGMLESGMETGANEAWDQLAEYLAANA